MVFDRTGRWPALASVGQALAVRKVTFLVSYSVFRRSGLLFSQSVIKGADETPRGEAELYSHGWTESGKLFVNLLQILR